MYLGIDGGQTKTVGIIISIDGAILAHTKTKAMPHQGALTNDCLEMFKDLFNTLFTQAKCSIKDITHVCGGLCGIDSESQATEKHAILSQYLSIPPKRLTLVNDAINALWGAAGHRPTLLLQHGTAFTSAIRLGNGDSLVHDCIDIGRVYDIRTELIVTIARMIDGRIPTTNLKEKALNHFGISDEKDFCFAIDYYEISEKKQKNTIELLASSWEEGDIGADLIMQAAAEDYALMCDMMLKKVVEEKATIVFGGGVLNRLPDSFLALCKSYIKSSKELEIVRPILEPVVGAALYAAHLANAPLDFNHTIKAVEHYFRSK